MPEFSVNFAAALENLGPDAALDISRELGENNTVFDTLLPDREVPSYHAEAGSMEITATMAGLAAMDAPYAPVGALSASDFSEKLAKIASQTVYSERSQRLLQDKLKNLFVTGGNTAAEVERAILDFANGVVVQAHRDTATFLKARAIVAGLIDWQFNGLRLEVDYGVPAGNKFANRTGAAGYGGNASTFWADVRAARSLLKNRVRTVIAHSETIDMIVSNPANALDVLAQNEDGTSFTVRKYRGTLERPETDVRFTLTLTAADDEGYILNPAAPGTTIAVPFMPFGKVTFVGTPTTRPVLGETSGDLGFTHVGPTVEGGGLTGRWARVYVPENKAYQLRGEAVTNLLPVITAPQAIVTLSTEMV